MHRVRVSQVSDSNSSCLTARRARSRHVWRHAEFDAAELNFLPGQLTACAILVGAAVARRPVGWSIDAVTVSQSSVAGKGVFATDTIEAGTVIGRYPGILRHEAEVRRAPQATTLHLPKIIAGRRGGWQGDSMHVVHRWR
jgi:hypothetical protein